MLSDLVARSPLMVLSFTFGSLPRCGALYSSGSLASHGALLGHGSLAFSGALNPVGSLRYRDAIGGFGSLTTLGALPVARLARLPRCSRFPWLTLIFHGALG